MCKLVVRNVVQNLLKYPNLERQYIMVFGTIAAGSLIAESLVAQTELLQLLLYDAQQGGVVDLLRL